MTAVVANPAKTAQKYAILTGGVLLTIFIARRIPVVKDYVNKALNG